MYHNFTVSKRPYRDDRLIPQRSICDRFYKSGSRARAINGEMKNVYIFISLLQKNKSIRSILIRKYTTLHIGTKAYSYTLYQ